MKVKELLTDRSKWVKRNYAVDQNGASVGALSDEAEAWCLLGAIKRCYPDWITVVRKIECSLALPRFGLAGWNDDQRRTWKEVKELINRLDI